MKNKILYETDSLEDPKLQEIVNLEVTKGKKIYIDLYTTNEEKVKTAILDTIKYNLQDFNEDVNKEFKNRLPTTERLIGVEFRDLFITSGINKVLVKENEEGEGLCVVIDLNFDKTQEESEEYV